MSKKLFISIPMRGYDVKDIYEVMQYMHEWINDQHNTKYELINTLLTDDISENQDKNGTYYLGRSIELLSQADLVMFHPKWPEARGCLVEHAVCALYNIPYVEFYSDGSYQTD